jgi:hypothetical protein
MARRLNVKFQHLTNPRIAVPAAASRNLLQPTARPPVYQMVDGPMERAGAAGRQMLREHLLCFNGAKCIARVSIYESDNRQLFLKVAAHLDVHRHMVQAVTIAALGLWRPERCC